LNEYLHEGACLLDVFHETADEERDADALVDYQQPQQILGPEGLSQVVPIET